MLDQFQPYLAPRRAILIAGGISAALLAGAHLFERVGGLEPCLLCLDQREVHWTALAVAVVGVIATFVRPSRIVLGVVLGVMAAVFLYSASLGAFHAGVEWDFWDGPMACAAGGAAATLDPGAISLDTLGGGPSGPPCEVAAWRMLGISMAGYNALISLALAVFAGAAAWRVAKPPQGAAV